MCIRDSDTYWADRNALVPVATAAAKKAEAEAKARRASKSDVALAINAACEAVYREVAAKEPKPIRFDMVEKPRQDSGNAPVVVASNGPVSYTHLDVYKRQAQRSSPSDRIGGVPHPHPLPGLVDPWYPRLALRA